MSKPEDIEKSSTKLAAGNFVLNTVKSQYLHRIFFIFRHKKKQHEDTDKKTGKDSESEEEDDEDPEKLRKAREWDDWKDGRLSGVILRMVG